MAIRSRDILPPALLVFLACGSNTDIVDRPVTVNVPGACAMMSPTNALSTFVAAGDFDPGPIQPTAQVPLLDTSASLVSLPATSKSLTLGVSQQSSGTTSAWTGVSLIDDSGPVNVLAWPTNVPAACPLSANVERANATLAAIDDRRVLIVGGQITNADGTKETPHSFLANMQTGHIDQLAIGTKTTRISPTVTAFGSGALVAGGSSPDTGSAIDTAEVYLVGQPFGAFDQAPIYLSEPRANHGAIVLANGKTLLVGGTNTTDPTGKALSTMETIDPSDRSVNTDKVAHLAVARMNPTVMRLASGEILVAGGFTPGVKTATNPTPAPVPVATLEWFNADATAPTKHARDLLARKNRAFVPLDAGGALAVIAPDESDISDANFQTTWIISGEGVLQPGVPIPGIKNNTIAMFRGASGSPMLYTGGHWLRYEPWFAAFDTVASAPGDGPRIFPNATPSTYGAAAASASVDAGLVLWLAGSPVNGAQVYGYRFATANAYADIPSPLLTTSPSYFALDRAPSDVTRYDSGTLSLEPGATAMLTDVTFAAFSLELQTSVSASPLVVLRDDAGTEFIVGVGGVDCPLLNGGTIQVERHGAVVTTSVDKGDGKACTKTIDPKARLHVGLRGGAADKSVVTSFTIDRKER